MCNILSILCNEKQIEKGKFKSILSEKEPEKRFEEFQELILTSGTTVFQQFMKYLKNAEISRKFVFFCFFTIFCDYISN